MSKRQNGKAVGQQYRHSGVGEMAAGVWRELRIVSGGQTGVDQAALEVAAELYLPCGGWCPKGRLQEDGVIDGRFVLQEAIGPDWALRTELNVRHSDGTLVLTGWEAQDGTPLTTELALFYERPHFEIDLSEPALADETVNEFRAWIEAHRIRTLNVGGPRESLRPGSVKSNARQILRRLLEA